MEPYPGIAHHDLLKLIFSVGMLLGSARVLGELAERVKLPAVVGEIMAGVILGPSVLSGIFPSFGRWIVPDTPIQGQLLDVVGLVGIILLMVVVGLETDLALIRARFRVAAAVGLGGLVVPFALGLGFALMFPGDLLVDGSDRIIFGLFVATALALSAIPVLAKILADMGLIRTRFGQTALAAGMMDDILGWTLLGIVTSLAASGSLEAGNVLLTVGYVLLFFIATFAVARPLAKWSLRITQDRFRGGHVLLSLLVVMSFLWGAFSQALRLEPIIGAFAIGIVFGQMRRFPGEASKGLEAATFGIFAPIFLATAGLRLSVEALLTPRILGITGLFLLVAVVGKVAGAYAGARYLAGSTKRESLGFGLALNARGVLGIIVASIGLSMGILTTTVYSMVIVVSVLTSLMAPIGLKLTLRPETVGEIQEAESLFSDVRRVLLAVRTREGEGGQGRSLEVSVLTGLAGHVPAVTLFTVAERSTRRAAERYLESLARTFPPDMDVSTKVVVGETVSLILDEAGRGYDLLALGASEAQSDSPHVFSDVVDEVIRLAPCPTLIFTARGQEWPPRRIMVPVDGTVTAARAADLAFALARDRSNVLLYHVVDRPPTTETSSGRGGSSAVRLEIGDDIVRELALAGRVRNVGVVTEVVLGSSMVDRVIARAGRGVDLIILGTGARSATQRLFLGVKVERILRESPCSVIVLNT